MAAPLAAGVTATGINWSGIASGLGNIGSFLGGIGSLFGSSGGTSTKKSMRLMDFQERLQERYLQNYYTNARKSLNDAGYNPMLAYMNNVSGGQTSATATEGNEVGQRAQAIANIIQAHVAKSQIQNTNANTVKQMAEAQTELERPELIRQQAIGQGLANILSQKDVDWYEKEKQAEIYLKYATGYGAITSANAQDTMAETNKEWTPAKIGAGILGGVGAGLVTAFGPGKFVKGVKAVKDLPRWFKGTKFTKSGVPEWL